MEQMRHQPRREQMCRASRRKRRERWGQKGAGEVGEDKDKRREKWRGEASHHLAEVMTQHISGRCLLLLLYRGHKLIGRESSAPALHCDNTTMSQAAGTEIKKCY